MVVWTVEGRNGEWHALRSSAWPVMAAPQRPEPPEEIAQAAGATRTYSLAMPEQARNLSSRAKTRRAAGAAEPKPPPTGRQTGSNRAPDGPFGRRSMDRFAAKPWFFRPILRSGAADRASRDISESAEISIIGDLPNADRRPPPGDRNARFSRRRHRWPGTLRRAGFGRCAKRASRS